MAHYAFLDENNIVTEVIVGVDETEMIEGLDTETWYSQFRNQTCKRTSYNGKIRKHFAGIGFYYDENLDAFIPPKLFNSWVLNEDGCYWDSPVPRPEFDSENPVNYVWNEELVNWQEVSE
jgi:hypothetical protein